MNSNFKDDDDLLFYIPLNITLSHIKTYGHELNSASSGIWTQNLVIKSWKH